MGVIDDYRKRRDSGYKREDTPSYSRSSNRNTNSLSDIEEYRKRRGALKDTSYTGTMQQKAPQPNTGNIDLNNRPIYKNRDGSFSTVDSFSVNIDGKEVLLPTISRNGNGDPIRLSKTQAVRNYLQTGKNLGKFNTPEEADAYAQNLHNDQEELYGPLIDEIKKANTAYRVGQTITQNKPAFSSANYATQSKYNSLGINTEEQQQKIRNDAIDRLVKNTVDNRSASEVRSEIDDINARIQKNKNSIGLENTKPANERNDLLMHSLKNGNESLAKRLDNLNRIYDRKKTDENNLLGEYLAMDTGNYEFQSDNNADEYIRKSIYDGNPIFKDIKSEWADKIYSETPRQTKSINEGIYDALENFTWDNIRNRVLFNEDERRREETIGNLSENQQKEYSYLLGKYGKERADSFLDSVEESAKEMNAQRIAYGINTSDPVEKFFKETKLAAQTGWQGFERASTYQLQHFLDQSTEITPATAQQYAYQLVEEQASDPGRTWMGLAQNIVNMAPTQLASAAATIATGGKSKLAEIFGIGVGMFPQALGSSYEYATGTGKDTKSATDYAFANALNQAGLEYALGGIEGVSENIIESGIKTASPAIARTLSNNFALQMGVNAIEESTEEIVQGSIESWLKNRILGENNIINPFSAENLEEAKIAGLSTLMQNAPHFAVMSYKISNMNVEEMADFAKAFEEANRSDFVNKQTYDSAQNLLGEVTIIENKKAAGQEITLEDKVALNNAFLDYAEKASEGKSVGAVTEEANNTIETLNRADGYNALINAINTDGDADGIIEKYNLTDDEVYGAIQDAVRRKNKNVRETSNGGMQDVVTRLADNAVEVKRNQYNAIYEAGKNQDNNAAELMRSAYRLTEDEKREALGRGLAEAKRLQRESILGGTNESSSRGQEQKPGMDGFLKSEGVQKKRESTSRYQKIRAAQIRTESKNYAAEVEASSIAGNGVGKVTVLSKEYLKKDKALAKIVADNASAGIKTTLIIGNLQVEEDGDTFPVRGWISDDRKHIVIRVDHETFTPEQINSHERFHKIKTSNPKVVQGAIAKIKSTYTEEEIDRLAEKYARMYLNAVDMSNEKDADYVFEELCADIYAGMETLPTDAQLSDFKPYVDEAISETETRENGTRGSPKYSIDPGLKGTLQKIFDRKYDSEEEILIGTTSDFIINKLHAPESISILKVVAPPRKAYLDMASREKAIKDKVIKRDSRENCHDLGVDKYLSAVEKSENPVAAFVSLNTATKEPSLNRITLVTDELDNSKNPIVVAMEFSSTTSDGTINVNKDITVFGKNNIKNRILDASKDGRLLFLNKNNQYFKDGPGVQFSDIAFNIDYESNIQNFWDNFKTSKEISEKKKVSNNAGAVISETTKSDRTFESIRRFKYSKDLSTENPISYNDKFIALHNMNADAMRGALELGGLAMPSIALTSATAGHNTYGDISVIYGRDTVDPTRDRNNSIYSGDAYTPTFPSIGYKVNTDVMMKMRDKMESLIGKYELGYLGIDTDNIRDDLERFGGDYVRTVKGRLGYKLAYLLDKGVNVKPPMIDSPTRSGADEQAIKKAIKVFGDLDSLNEDSRKLMDYIDDVKSIMREYYNRKFPGKDYAEAIVKDMGFNDARKLLDDALTYRRNNGIKKTIDKSALENIVDKKLASKAAQSHYEEWLRELSDGIIAKRGIRNSADLFTPSGNRRSFEQLYFDYSLDNVVRAMRTERKQGMTGMFTGSGNIRGAAAKQYASIEDARSDIGRIRNMGINEADAEEMKAFDDKTLELCNRMIAGKGHNRFTGPFDAAEVITEVVSKYKNSDSIYRYLMREGYDGYYNVTPEIARDIEDLIKEAQKLPTSYLEAKPYRAVPLNEALAYVVPNNIDKSLKQEMKDAGLNVVTYKNGDNEDRLNKIRKVNGAMFSRDTDYLSAVESGDMETAQKMVDDAAKEAGYNKLFYHGAKKGGGFTRFKDWSYFTENKAYAKRYMQRDNENSLYTVYAKMDNPFDTRKAKDRKLFEQARQEYGMGEIQDNGLPDWTDGYDIADYIDENELDYDSIVLDEGGDLVNGEPVSRGFSYVIRKSNQIKSADPVTYDENGNVIPISERFNRETSDLRFSRDLSPEEIEEENEDLRRKNIEMANVLAKANWRPDNTAVKETANRLKNMTGSSMKITDIERRLGNIYSYIYNSDQVDGDLLVYAENELAKDLIDSGKVEYIPGEMEQYKDVKKYLRENKIIATNEIKSEIGDFQLWRKRNRSIFFSKDGQSIDKVYEGLNDRYPQTFQEGLSDGDKVIRISEYLTDERPKPISNGTEYDYDEFVFELRNIIDDAYMNTKFNAGAVASAKESLRAQYNQLKADYKQKLDERYKERELKKNLRKQNRDAMQDLIKKARRLSRMKGDADFRSKVDELIGNVDLVAPGIKKDTEQKLRDLREQVLKQAELDPDYAAIQKPKYDDLFLRLERRHISDMTPEEIAQLTEQIAALEHSKRTYDREIRENDARTFAERGRNGVAQQKKAKGINYHNIIGATTGKYELYMLNPVRAMALIDGYQEDGEFSRSAKELNEGQTKAANFRMETEKMFQEANNDRSLINDFSKQVIDIGGGHKISKGMRISLYLSSKNRANLEHIAYGGIRIPDADLYAKGNYTEAYTHGDIIKLTPSQVKAITDKMTAGEKKYADIAYIFFNTITKNAINETSLALDGYERAIVQNYFPIKTDPRFTKKSFDSLKRDATIEGWGSLKERQANAKNPVLLEDVSQVVLRQMNNTARYYGLAIPIRNFNKFYAYTSTGYADSVKNAVARTWGKVGEDYIENMITDIQSPRRAEPDILDKLKGLYAGATLNLNAGVAIKQSASYPFAASVIGWKPLVKALGSAFSKADYEYMDSITPWSYMRRQGMSGTEMGEVAKQRTTIQNSEAFQKLKAKSDWIRRVDVKTTDVLFFASEEYVKENYPKLKVRSEGYNQKVAEIYNEVLQRTQPSYDVMQRSEYLRSPGTVAKVFGMFKTQTFNMGGEIIDSWARLKAYENLAKTDDKYKAKVTEAKKAVVNTAAATIISQAMLAVLTAAANALLHKMKNYRDDEGEVTAESIIGRVTEDFIKSFGGMFMAGDVAQNAILSLIGKDKWYDITFSGLDGVNDFVSTSISFAESLRKAIQEGDADARQKILPNAIRLANNGLIVSGIPANNIYNMANSFFLWGKDFKNREVGSFEAGEGLFGLTDTSVTKQQYANRAISAAEENDMEKFTDALDNASADTIKKALKAETADDAFQKIISMDIGSDYMMSLIGIVSKSKAEELDKYGIDPKNYNSYTSGTKNPKISDVPSKGFGSSKDLNKAFATGRNENLHHIVEQEQEQLSGFSTEQIQNLNNAVSLPSGAKSVHEEITNYYNSVQDFTNGKTVRQWLSGKPFEEQFNFGVKQLQKYGDMVPTSTGWRFVPDKEAIDALIPEDKAEEVNSVKSVIDNVIDNADVKGDDRYVFLVDKVNSKEYSAEQIIEWFESSAQRTDSKSYKAWKDIGGSTWDYVKSRGDLGRFTGNDKQEKIARYLKRLSRDKRDVLWQAMGYDVGTKNYYKYFK